MFIRSTKPVACLARYAGTTVAPRWAVLTTFQTRRYAQSWDNRNSNEQIEAHIKIQKLLDSIQANPKVFSKLNSISELLYSKGLVNEETAPGPWQMIKILTDKDVRQKMVEFREELEKAGIELGPEQLGPLMTVLGMNKPNK
ncbi:LAMI_0G05666g1_1 [Lachancea mirantina]|uniref:LAMI_0G05666g1_1 n=1 Tax=Lachancea mirantina TaxID=1230905 RepID=A0A1G4K8Y5_9SACH|nr:LAMI_0G05666g1_1 [Lachancea mirantina]